ncbi:hypothetical protein EOD41_14930 [Mucilaginibacter limnophilus]|uniref:Methylamine utilisation protein MauE domain-containing protein n=1 Tax=Mucilaginibacter limnophilus TaxID=1932778 RepID=A0A437MQ19_9SPHI|nr:MauE/DoxX family redox-associated membrane protein [Mucilaginibacter limnophilus]RVT99736.1 hypothetical protein EOD41_14930 [Mucilaginibacter limnophilus]
MPGLANFRWITPVARFLLIILWVYAVAAKMRDFQRYAYEMQQQVFSAKLATFLAYALPLAELLAVIMLIAESTVFAGLALSAMLLLAFTGYSAAVLLHWFPKIPCPCGGLISELSWLQHLLFNLSFLLLTLISILTIAKERRSTAN